MAELKPFQGVHYVPEKIGDLADVTIPPYDVITPGEQAAYHARHPYNFIRLALGETLPGDSGQSNCYTRAAGYLHSWLQDGILTRDSQPSLYIIEQPYSYRDKALRRRGIIGVVRLEPFENRVILPHEKTLSGPKADRLNLIRATRANLDSVFGIYKDNTGIVAQALQKAVSAPPLLEFPSGGAGDFRFWQVSEPEWIWEVASVLEDSQILIADGHHRYETALNYRAEQRAAGSSSLAEDYVLITLVESCDEGLTILPTHRVVRSRPSLPFDRLLPLLEETFRAEPLAPDLLVEAMRQKRPGCAVGCYAGKGRAFGLTLAAAGKEAMARMSPNPAWQELDVAVLHTLILNRIFGLDFEKEKGGESLLYTADDEAAVALVDDSYDCAFLLSPPDIDTVWKVAQAGGRMPQKSTYFYPKLTSGVVLRLLEPEK
ncbi:MAG: DUF1015 domain-containing protein [Armatimonadetes bacterium]|nr:DUF1015 domain-containing protein [Armatimonadota bacterium]